MRKPQKNRSETCYLMNAITGSRPVMRKPPKQVGNLLSDECHYRFSTCYAQASKAITGSRPVIRKPQKPLQVLDLLCASLKNRSETCYLMNDITGSRPVMRKPQKQVGNLLSDECHYRFSTCYAQASKKQVGNLLSDECQYRFSTCYAQASKKQVTGHRPVRQIKVYNDWSRSCNHDDTTTDYQQVNNLLSYQSYICVNTAMQIINYWFGNM
jgi:hypothetical protein